ncbi:MAG: methyl-accepting chemotaxis protein [Pseudomonadota bacterium]
MAIQLWMALACVLVAAMQIGFLFLEAGFVRSKNSINVSMKNLADFVLAVLSFHILGAAIMFGGGLGFVGFDTGLIAYSGSGEITLFLLFQALFCGTAATIVSGAVAERMRFTAYLILTLPLTMLVYPMVGHWAWGGLLPGAETQGWLERVGFFDFAGSSVVHLTGGAAALAILMVVGARDGRFGKRNEELRSVHGHSPILAGSGALVLLVGWLGFNSGGLEPGSDEFARALSNTLLAGSAGSLGALVFAHQRDGFFRADRAINGLLTGLVAITASAPFAYSLGAIILGAAAGMAGVAVTDWLEQKRRIDDAVYAVSVHGFGGVFGTVAVPLIVPSSVIANAMFVQLGVQLLGVAVIGSFVFAAMGTIARSMHARGALRVSLEDERRGLNLSEHNALMGNAELVKTLNKINDGVSDIGTRIEMDPFDEGGDIAQALNTFLGRVEASERAASERLRSEQRETAKLAQRETDRANANEALLGEFQLEFASLVEQLKAQARELSGGSQALAEKTAQSGALVDEAGQEATGTVDIAEQMAQGASLLAQTLEMVGHRVESAHVAAEAADLASVKGSEIAGTLESSTKEIGKLVALIEAISDKTGLLAFNARIEAARAGDAGLGFSVVSEEVGDLARQTEAATREIADIVGSLTNLIGQSIAQFRAIDESMETVREVAAEAAETVRQQSASSAELGELITGARDRAFASGEAVARVSDNFAASSPTIQRIDESSDELTALAIKIDREVEQLRARFGQSVGTRANSAS